MTDEMKLEVLKSLPGNADASDDTLSYYLSMAKDVVIHRRYPFLESYDGLEVPAQYETIQIRIANELFSKAGAEGEIKHDENGIKREYEKSGVSQSLLNEISPCGRGFI